MMTRAAKQTSVGGPDAIRCAGQRSLRGGAALLLALGAVAGADEPPGPPLTARQVQARKALVAVANQFSVIVGRLNVLPEEACSKVDKLIAAFGEHVLSIPDAYKDAHVPYWRCKAFAALGQGRAAEAAEAAGELLRRRPLSLLDVNVALLAAVARGDRAGAFAALTTLEKHDRPGNRRYHAFRRRQLALLGMTVPPFKGKLADGSTFAFTSSAGDPDKTFVFDFWAVRLDPPEKVLDAVRRLYARYQDRRGFAMVGVNRDVAASATKVRAFIDAHELRWPQVLEGKLHECPISHRIFQVDTYPHVVVVGPEGRLRFAGTPDDPAVHYAIRAGLAGEPGVALPPGTTLPVYKPPEIVVEPEPEPSPADAAREAQRLLTRARVMLRLKQTSEARALLKRIVADYPRTEAAPAAARLLQSLGAEFE